MPHVFTAGLRLNGEAGRHRQSGVGHLGKARTLSTEFVFHLSVAIGLAAAEKVNVFDGGHHSLRFMHVRKYGSAHGFVPFGKQVMNSRLMPCVPQPWEPSSPLQAARGEYPVYPILSPEFTGGRRNALPELG